MRIACVIKQIFNDFQGRASGKSLKSLCPPGIVLGGDGIEGMALLSHWIAAVGWSCGSLQWN